MLRITSHPIPAALDSFACMSNSVTLSNLAPVSNMTNSVSLNDNDVPYRTALPNSWDGRAIFGTDNQGPKGPANPVLGRDDSISSRMDICSWDIDDGDGPAYRGINDCGDRRRRLRLRLRRWTTTVGGTPFPSCPDRWEEGPSTTGAAGEDIIRYFWYFLF